MKNNKQIVDLQYFGSINYYLKLINSTHIYFFNERGHEKGLGWNRTRILGANKILTLSVPLQGGRSVKAPLSAVRIAADEGWQRIHWRSIHDSYRKAPWFEEYAPSLQNLYTQNYIFLWDWNMACTKWALKVLGINADILSCSGSEETPTQNIHPPAPPYYQVFADRHGGFVPDLSILDLILNEGPRSVNYLQSL